MAGVLFVICVPTEIYERSFKKSHDSEFSVTEECTNDIYSSQEDFLLNDDTVHKTKTLKCKPFAMLKNEQPEVTSSTLSDDAMYKMPLEKILRKILEGHKIKNAVWTKGESGKYLQVLFPSDSGFLCEGILAVLNEYGIGKKLNSVVSVIPCSIYYKNEEGFDKMNSDENTLDFNLKNEQEKKTVWNRFVTSVSARLTVAQVVEVVRANAALTFDFVVLLLIASTLSAIALSENNNIYLVSSMLISPMMGPVLAGTFGQVIKDKKLQKIGVVNELIGIGIAALVGFCYGSIITTFTDKYGQNTWPTYEMTSRGEIRTLWVGCLIALLSGAAVALGILGDNFASLVGVAISVSLMPPAVNAGLLWAMASVYAIAGENSSKSIVRTNFYSNNDVYELAALGAVSMCLTFVNIVCIYIAGIFVFKIKEVAPLSSKDQSRRFWKHDIKIARNYNLTLQKDEANILSEEILSLGQNLPSIKTKDNLKSYSDYLFHSTDLKREHSIDVGKIQNTWSPKTFEPRRPTVQDLKALYFTNDKPKVQKNLNFSFNSMISNRIRPSCSHNKDNDIVEPTTLDTEVLIPKQKYERQPSKGKKKFVVTPAKIDNI